MTQQQIKRPSVEHYEDVINRLSHQIGLLTVEKTSMAVALVEKDREILQLRQEIADLKEPANDKEPELVK